MSDVGTPCSAMYVPPVAHFPTSDGMVTETRNAKQLKIEHLRKTLPAFRSGNTRVCNNYCAFGGRWLWGKDGDKKVFPRRQKQTCIMYIDPEEWNALRLSVLDEAGTDMMIFLLFGVHAGTNPQDMEGHVQVGALGHALESVQHHRRREP